MPGGFCGQLGPLQKLTVSPTQLHEMIQNNERRQRRPLSPQLRDDLGNMATLDIAIDQGYEAATLIADVPDGHAGGVACSIDLASPGQPLSDEGKSVARFTA